MVHVADSVAWGEKEEIVPLVPEQGEKEDEVEKKGWMGVKCCIEGTSVLKGMPSTQHGKELMEGVVSVKDNPGESVEEVANSEIFLDLEEEMGWGMGATVVGVNRAAEVTMEWATEVEV